MTITKPQPLSIVETISVGYAALNRRLWVVLIPFALDLYLWFGMRVSFAPFFRLIRDWLAALVAVMIDNPQQQEQVVVSILNVDIRSIVGWLSIVPVFVPQLWSDRSSGIPSVIYVGSPLGILAVLLLLSVVALLVSSLFLTMLATGLQRERVALATYFWRWITATLGMAGYGLLLCGAVALVSIPGVAMVVGLTLVAPKLTSLGLLVWFGAWFWMYIYTGFAVEAVLLDGVNPAQAVSNSIQLVRHSFLGTLALLLLSALIVSGTRVLWQSLMTSTLGLLLALLGSAYISSGLVAARLVFYRDRFRLVKTSMSSKHEQKRRIDQDGN